MANDGNRSYVAEVYVPRRCGGTLGDAGAHVRAAAVTVSAEGIPVRFVRSLLVPEDETCFLLFETRSPDAVWETTQRAGLAPERVVEAVEEPR